MFFIGDKVTWNEGWGIVTGKVVGKRQHGDREILRLEITSFQIIQQPFKEPGVVEMSAERVTKIGGRDA